MVVHLGRLKVVTRRKDGKCRYKHCEKDHKLVPGDRTLVLTKMGVISGKPTIYYKAYHPECFGPWVLWMCEQVPASRDGRKTMELSNEDKLVRLKLVRERARILRALRTVTAEVLPAKVERITELDKLISKTGYPVMHYTGRKSKSSLDLESFIKEVKEKYGTARRVPVSMWERAKELGLESQFSTAMNEWYKEGVSKSSSGQDYESQEEDKEEE